MKNVNHTSRRDVPGRGEVRPGARRFALALALGAAACSAPAKAPAPTPVKSQQGALSGVNAGHAIIRSEGCFANVVEKCDDCSTGAVDLLSAFPGGPNAAPGLNFHGSHFTSLYINNNGNVTFQWPQSSYTPFDLNNAGQPIISPYFGDVWTWDDCVRDQITGNCQLDGDGNPIPADGGTVSYGTTTYDVDGVSRPAFCVTWDGTAASGGVAYYYDGYDRRNQFQLLLVNRDDRQGGDFDIVFNYDKIGWETGQASCLDYIYYPGHCETSLNGCYDDSSCDAGTGEHCIPNDNLDGNDCAVYGQSIGIHRATGEPYLDASGQPLVFGYTPRAGYYSGNQENPASLYQIPGSGVSQAFVDQKYGSDGPNVATGLIWNNGINGSPDPNGQAGRYVFEIKNDPPVGVAVISGQIKDQDGNGFPNASFEVCQDRTGGLCVYRGRADASGNYQAFGISTGSFFVRAFPPANSNNIPGVSDEVRINTDEPVIINGIDIVLDGPHGPPPGTSIEPSNGGGGGVPTVFWGNALTLSKTGCTGGVATYEVRQGTTVQRTGTLTEGPAGTYTGTIPAFYPIHGNADVVITLTCPDGSTSPTEFNIYIDPSGVVRTLGGHPIQGATVTVYRWQGTCETSGQACGASTECGQGESCVNFSFVAIPDGSDVMSPANRTNPMLTDAQGHFGWDVIAGYYKVRAEKAGCVSGDLIHPGAYIESNTLQIPPAVIDLDLRLDCGPEAVDTTPPVIHVPGTITTQATQADGAVVTYAVTATDDVDGFATVTCVPASGSVFAIGTTTVTCSAHDSSNNTATNSFQVVVLSADSTPPTITTPSVPAVEATGAAGAVVTYAASASDETDGAVAVSCTPASGSTFALGDTTVTCTASDSHSNAASASFHVLVVDTTAPALTVPDSVNADTTQSGGAAVTFATSATDIVDGAVAVSCTPASGSTFAIGTTSVSCTAQDAHGNSASRSFPVVVTYRDTVAPVLSIPGDLTVEATSASGAAVTYAATAMDDYDGPVAASCTPASGSAFALGSTTVNCTAADSAGNTATGSFQVLVRDTTAPVLTVPSGLTVEADDVDDASAACASQHAGSRVTFVTSASDAVSGDVAVTCSPASGSFFALGTTTVTCSATDGAGNSSSRSFSVLVRDTTGPSLQISLTPTLIWPPNHKMVTVSITKQVSDGGDRCPQVACSAVSSEPAVGGGSGNTAADVAPAGPTTGSIQVRAERSGSGTGRTYTVTCVAKDRAGNTTTRTGTVRVPHNM